MLGVTCGTNQELRTEYSCLGNTVLVSEIRQINLQSGEVLRTYYAYDSVGRLSGLNQNFTGTAYDTEYTFGYNPASQLTTQTISNDSYVWTGGVNVNRAYAVNGLNQYTSAGPASFSYDANACPGPV